MLARARDLDNVFTSTRPAEELRVGRIEPLVITGVLTDAGAESSARHAAERDVQVIVVDDACAAWEEGCHAARPRSLSRCFARITVVAGIERATADGGTR
jgi:ureidoacrylate peracid hydrolase